MLIVFLTQLAAGCLLAVACLPIRTVAWRYLRLMAVVCLAALVCAVGLLAREVGRAEILAPRPHLAGLAVLAVALACTLVWLGANALQGPAIRSSQRLFPLLGGCCAAAAATIRVLESPAGSPELLAAAPPAALAAASLTLGAAVLGSTTAAMLLGHRYLMDADMTIAPLRRLTALVAGTIAVRIVGVLAILAHGGFGSPTADAVTPGLLAGRWSWVGLVVAVRVGVGLLCPAVFAYMVWDCVRRRSTQSATGILYVTMVCVFVGELAGQYLLRSAGLAV